MDDPLWRNVSTGQNARSAPHGSAAAPRTSDGRIGTVPHPVLVVAGTDDPLTSVVNGMIMTHLLPQGRLLVAHGEGHLMLLDSRSAALTPLHEFFEADELATRKSGSKRPPSTPNNWTPPWRGKKVQMQPVPLGAC